MDDRCIATRIRRPGCRVVLDGAPASCLIVDFDEPGSPLGDADASCDYLFVAEDDAAGGWVAPLELTTGPVDASKFVQAASSGRLCCGAAGAKERGGEIPSYRRLWRRFTYSREAGKLQRNDSQVSFHGMREPVRLMKCGMRNWPTGFNSCTRRPRTWLNRSRRRACAACSLEIGHG